MLSHCWSRVDLPRASRTVRHREGRVDPSDVAEVVRRAAAGDQTAWNELVDAFSRMLWAVVSGFRLSRADTTDVVQSTWLRLVENLDKIKQPEAVGGWLATTARREALRHLRLRAHEVITDGESRFDVTPLVPPPGPEDHAIERDRERRLWLAFDRLPDNCRVLLHLLSVVAMSYHEVAAALDMPIGSIGPTRARCLDRLRRLVDGEGGL